MVEVQKLIPSVYNQSRDFSIFTGIMQIILNELELKSRVLDKLPNEDILPWVLADFSNLRPYFRKMLKYKGSPECLVYAVVLCGGNTLSFDTEANYLLGLSTPVDVSDPYTYFDRNDLSQYPGIDSSRLVYWGEVNTTDSNSKTYIMHINVEDQSTVNFDLLKKLEYYLKPVNTIIKIDKLTQS